jgi:polysaccharide export outer membrane protein
VRDAGAFEIDAPITFIEALALAGGLDEGAKSNALAVIRVEGDEFVASLYQSKSILAAKADQPATIGFLLPGDIVFVPQTGLSSAAEVSRQVQDLIGFSGYSGSFGYRFREINDP